MKLRLTRLPADKVVGIYGVNDRICDKRHANGEKHADYGRWDLLAPRTMPERMRALAPEAAVDYLRAWDQLVVSDMFRSPESSLKASQNPKKKALPPSSSGHNFGFSIDVHTTAMRSRLGLKSKRELDEFMAQFGFYNFWIDGAESHEHEDWHYNHITAAHRDRDGGFSKKTDRTSGYLEKMIVRLYGAQMQLGLRECQAALKQLGDYNGVVDAIPGRLTRAATAKFQARWMPKHQTGELDDATQRLLAYLTAEVEWVPLPAEMPARC